MSDSNLSGPEKMFQDQLAAIGASIEGVLIRPPRDWLPELYGYRITKADGSQVTGFVDWDLDTFSNLMTIAKA